MDYYRDHSNIIHYIVRYSFFYFYQLNQINLYHLQSVLMELEESNQPKEQIKAKAKFRTKMFDWFFSYEEYCDFSLNRSHISDKSLSFIRLLAIIYYGFTNLWILSSLASLGKCIEQLQFVGYLLSFLYFLLLFEDYFINGRNRLFPIASKLKFKILIIFEMAFCSQLALTPYFFSRLHNITNDNSTTIMELALIYNLLLGPLFWLSLDLIFNSYPFSIKHFIFPISLITILFASNAIYHQLIESPFQLVHWNRIQDYLFMSISIVLLFLSFLLGRLLFVRWKQRRLKDIEDIVEVALIDRIMGKSNINNNELANSHVLQASVFNEQQEP